LSEPVIIGNATLYQGDCLEILPTLSGIDAVVTDPPYGVSLKKKTSDFRGSRHFDNGESLRASILYKDSQEHVAKLIQKAMPLLLRCAKRAVITPGARMMFAYPEPAAVSCVFTANGAGLSPWGFQCAHPILYYGKDPYLAAGMGSRPNGFKTEQPNLEQIDHPCPKPVIWMKWLVNRASFEGETILDPFMGSGTTGVAAVQLGRKFIGIELEPRYFDIACQRIEDAQRQGRLFQETAA
jgi:DNA modification methylase